MLQHHEMAHCGITAESIVFAVSFDIYIYIYISIFNS